jgi:hypothetical protein
LIGLCPYADTTNPGGVYILAICNVDSGTPVDPRSCKYDAFKVRTKGKPKTDLAISKTAVPSFSRTNAWEIDKTLESLSLNQQTSQATLEYTIEWTKTTTNTDYQVTGIILVANANDATATEVVVTDQIGSTSCSVTPPDGFDGTIAPQDELTFAYVCNFESAQSGSATNVATVTWTKSSIGSPNSSATASVGFTWPTNATTTTGPESVSIVDIFDGGSPETLVASTSTSGSTTLTKTKTITTPAACTEIVNIARAQFVNDVAQVVVVAQDSVSTEVCVNEGGFTMGFWRNPNGQALINSADQTDLCSYLQQYSNVLPDLLVCSDIAAYVTGLIDTADASGSGIAMFKAQFLATALSAYFDPDLASTSIVVDSTLFNPSAGDCMTVSELLSAADSSYLTLETDKTDLLTVKDYFDGINNNLAFTC